jgi:hypothetical protein
MKKLSCFLILAVGMASTAWAADCKVPDSPRKMPEGTTAKKEEMVAFNKLVAQYNENVNTYLVCIKTEYDGQLKSNPDAEEAAKKQFLERYTKKNDAAVDVAQEFVGKWNEQLRAFKAQTAK